MNVFRTTFVGLGLVTACLGAAVALLVGWRQREHAELEKLARDKAGITRRLAAEQTRLKGMRAAHPPIVRFLAAWAPHLSQRASSSAAGAGMRAALEELAQRRLGLITDQMTTPEPAAVLIAGRPAMVQRVCLRASGESLGAILTWLGESEALFPYARVELCELAAGSGNGVSLRLGLAQPTAAERGERTGP